MCTARLEAVGVVQNCFVLFRTPFTCLMWSGYAHCYQASCLPTHGLEKLSRAKSLGQSAGSALTDESAVMETAPENSSTAT